MANTYKNAAVVISTTAVTDLYTTPANTRSIVQSVNVANVDGSDRYVTVTWYDASAGASFTLLYSALVPAGTSMNALDVPLVLEAGDVVRVQASASNTLHATASVLQQDPTSPHVDSSITTAKIADSAVTSAKIADATIVAADFADSVSRYDFVTDSTTSRTLGLSDSTFNKCLVFTSNSAVTVTVPAEATVNFPTGSRINLLYVGSGSLKVGGASGVTLLGQMTLGTGVFGGGSFGEYIINQSDSFTLIKTGTNQWASLVQQNTKSFAILC